MKQCIISGRLGRAPEVSSVGAESISLAVFSVAVDGWDSKAKEKSTTWVDCKVFGQTADFLAQHANPGDAVVVKGELMLDKYDSKKYVDAEGNPAKLTGAYVLAERFNGVELYKKAGGEGATGAPLQEKLASAPSEDDIPF